MEDYNSNLFKMMNVPGIQFEPIDKSIEAVDRGEKRTIQSLNYNRPWAHRELKVGAAAAREKWRRGDSQSWQLTLYQPACDVYLLSSKVVICV